MQNTLRTQEHISDSPSSINLEKVSLSSLVEVLNLSVKIQSLLSSLRAGQKVTLSGLCGSLGSILLAKLFEAKASPMLIVAKDETLQLYEHDLHELVGERSVMDFVRDPALVLSSLMAGEKKIVLSTPSELGRKVLAQDKAAQCRLPIRKGEALGYERVQAFLQSNGFERKDFVEQEGDYAVRGSIIDVFSFGALKPVRIEFFGDEVESIRSFDVNTQLSSSQESETEIVANLVGVADAAESILSYLPPKSLVVTSTFDDEDFGPSDSEYFSRREIEAKLQACAELQLLSLTRGNFHFEAEPQMRFSSNFHLFAESLKKDAERGVQSVVATASQKELTDVTEFLAAEYATETEEGAPLRLYTLPLNLYEGFRLGNVSLYTESDVFGKLHVHRRHRRRRRRQISLRDLRALKIGDFIVHEDYGIGIFMGLEKIQVAGAWQECVLIEYEKGDKLYVGLQNLHLLSKYSAGEGSKAKLSRLGSDKWQQQKERVKKRLKDIARNLIELYAKRKMTKGFAAPPDSVWMREFEAAFIFEETPDQLSAIEAVKRDMESPAPMDRLICGDAGFGKTEVAMRAAFKAVEGGKQVAVLVPTTILAHQHFQTFKQRFQNFPTRIEVLSRFVPKSEQKRIIEEIQKGTVDIVIGTHRLVSRDVRFKDLGLLIIDEEQHFGVATKEKLREEFPTVDTLTLTATPIPRTLQFSMMGARDLSIISTPPKNRQPIETIVHEFDQELIRQAIARELARGGQVFFLHNRINTIEQIFDMLKRLFPKARIRIAHAQLPSRELEQIMMDFLDKEIDILICTTIVESGLDISNVNTILINRADTLGLADLYQLRGRVGRSDRKAYCYLLTPPASSLTQEALQRLSAIEEFTELGSGFNVAMRDLDIRGAGNLLGAEQSGYIYELGFDVYQKILEEAVAELKSTEFQNIFKEAEERKAKPNKPTEVTFFFNALIPDYYVESASERFALYERLSKAASEESLAKLSAELQDRFGKLPEECEHLLLVARLRIVATALMISRLEIMEKKCVLTFPEAEDKNFYEGKIFGAVLEAVSTGALSSYAPVFKNEKRLKLEISFPKNYKDSPKQAVETILSILEKFQPVAQALSEV
jgi:transcription-repair coupling factor (superfamily II helicase)